MLEVSVTVMYIANVGWIGVRGDRLAGNIAAYIACLRLVSYSVTYSSGWEET